MSIKWNCLNKKAKELKDEGYKGIDLYYKLLLQFEGKPYLWGGEDLDGCDCSGTVCAALSNSLNLCLRETANGLYKKYFVKNVSVFDDMNGYTAVFFLNKSGKAVHVAGYCGNGFFINMSSLEPNEICHKRTLSELCQMYNHLDIQIRRYEV